MYDLSVGTITIDVNHHRYHNLIPNYQTLHYYTLKALHYIYQKLIITNR